MTVASRKATRAASAGSLRR